jgi:hypothetical protein
MTQNASDVEIANQGFAAFRQDLNDVLEDITTLHSGTAAPTTTYANQWWYETDTDKLYIRNEDNDAWIEILTLDQANDHLATLGATITLDGSGNASIDGTFDVNGNELILDADGDTSITADTDDQIDFKTGGSDRMGIDASGNVGIGTTSPDPGVFGLQVHNPSSDFSSLKLSNGATGSTSGDGTSFQIDASGNVRLRNFENTYMTLETNNTERMRIDSDGDVLIGSTTNVGTGDHKVSVDIGTAGRALGLSSSTTTTKILVSFINPNGTVGSIRTSGSGTSYVTSSDYRLKENAADISDGITRVKQLQPKRFNFIADDSTTVDGFMAHEAQAVVPEAVTGTQDEVDGDGNPVYQGIDQAKLVPLLTAALKEAIAKIETLETQATDFETRIAALESV